MQTEQANLYERAFQCFLTENKLSYVSIDQSKCPEYQNGPVKNFDFLVRPDTDTPILVELKGRTFKGTSLAGLKGLDAWVTFEDVRSLSLWLDQYRREKPAARAVFVFAFRFANIDIETDGWEVYDYAGRRFLFLGMPVDRYLEYMKIRSPKWQTVHLASQDFGTMAMPIGKMLECNETINNE